MSDVETLLLQCRELGVELIPQPDGKLKIRAPAPIPDTLRDELKHLKAEVITLLTSNRPSLNARGELIIPLSADPKYHYWKPGGQSLAMTLAELDASPDVWRRYVGSYSETRQ